MAGDGHTSHVPIRRLQIRCPRRGTSFFARGTVVASSRDGPRRYVVCGSSRDHFGNQFRERVEAPRCWVPRAVCAIIQRGLILPACSGSRRSDSRGSTSSFRFFPSDRRQERSFPLSSPLDLRNIIMKSRFLRVSSRNRGLATFSEVGYKADI